MVCVQINVYKRVVTRVDDGASLLDDYTRMVLERLVFSHRRCQ
jgi:hypothetical protein